MIPPRPFLLWVGLSHVLIAWFVAAPDSGLPLGHGLWLAPFGVAAVACAWAAFQGSIPAVRFAGVATVVAYSSRALAFPFAAVAGADVGPGLFITVIWTLLASYALRTFRGPRHARG